MENEAIVYFGIDIGKQDMTAYWIFEDGQIKEISKEEYERFLSASETTGQEFNN